MAVETTFDIGFGTKFDPTNLEEGLSKALARAERETENSAAKQVAAVAKAKLEEVKSVKAAENAKIEKRRSSTRTQVELIRATPNITAEQKEQWIKAEEESGRRGIEKLETRLRKRLSKIQESVVEEVRIINEGAEGRDAEKRREVEAVQEAEQQKVETVENSQSQQTAAVRDGTDERTGIVRDGGRRQSRALQEGNRGNLRSVEDFASGASQQLGGFMKTVTKALKGPVALGAAVVLAGRQIKRFLDSTAEAWRVEEQAQIALAAAARNNPYLNDRGVHQLRQFANEMQRLTGIDNVQVMGAQTRLAALGRNQREIEQIVRTAADIAATGLMSYDQAVDELSQSFSGFTRRLERMFPELKSLTEEAKMAGGAVNMIAESVSGTAEQAMRSGTGSVQAFNNAVESMRRSIGQDWEQAVRPIRMALTDVINVLVEARERAREYREAMREAAEAGAYITVSQQLRAYEAEMDRLQTRLAEAQRIAGQGFGRNLAESALFAVGGNLARMATGVGDIDMANASAWEAYLTRQVEALQGAIEGYGKAQAQIDRAIAAMQRSANDAGIAGTEVAERYAEAARHFATEALKILQQRGSIEAAMRQLAFAEERGEAVERERERIELEREHAKIRAENLEYLEKEIEMIMQKAQIEGRGTRTLEVQRRVLNARINAYTNLVRQIGAAGEAERRTLEELQREYLRLEIETANRLREDNLRGLENRRREIETMAELEGRAADSIRTQGELLDANVNAYQNQMRILRDLIDGTREEEGARRAALEAQWRQYAQEKQTARAQRERLQEMIQLQDELNQRVSRMHESAYGAMRNRDDLRELSVYLQRAREESEGLEESRTAAAMRADNAIAGHRLEIFRRTIERERKENIEAIDRAKKYGRHAEANRLMLNMRSWRRQAHERTAEEIQRIYSEMMEGIYGRDAEARVLNLRDAQLKAIGEVEAALMGMRFSNDDRTFIYQQFADKRVEIERRAAERIREINRQMIADINDGFDMFLDAFQNMTNNINTIWTNGIDRQTQDRLRANDAMHQSDEERAANEQRILKKAALERYKAELFAWTANVTFATAQAGMATLTAFAEALKGTGPAGPAIAAINAALVAAVSATKVAAVISAKPTPPRFHTGGVVRGRVGQDVPAILRTNEKVFTEGQFNNMQAAFASLAKMASHGPTQPSLSVRVENHAARDTGASAGLDMGELVITMEKIVGDGIAKGKYDAAFGRRDMRRNGRGAETF